MTQISYSSSLGLSLQELTALFGAEWAIENLIPSIVEIRQHKSYLRRLTALQACAMMATEMGLDATTVDVLPLILEMATDSVSLPQRIEDFELLVSRI
jgi:hypothetical protein